MENFKIGDKLKIECYKHNGYLDRVSDEATVIYYDEDKLIVYNDHTRLTEHDGSSHLTKEPAILFFYKDKWFNVIAQLKKAGLFYYCNIATPYLIDGGVIKYIDYDLDLRVYPDGGYRILDRNEYNYHKKVMHYSKELDEIVNLSLKKLIEIKKNNEYPFNKDYIESLANRYKELQNSQF